MVQKSINLRFCYSSFFTFEILMLDFSTAKDGFWIQDLETGECVVHVSDQCGLGVSKLISFMCRHEDAIGNLQEMSDWGKKKSFLCEYS